MQREKVFLSNRTARETGNTEEKWRIEFNNFGINLNKPLSNFQKYDTINESRKIRLFSNFYLPIIFQKTTNVEYKYEDIILTEEQAIGRCSGENNSSFARKDK